MDEPRWNLEVPIPGSDQHATVPFRSDESEGLAAAMLACARQWPELDTILHWAW